MGEYGWLLWALFALCAIVVYRLRRDGGDGSLPRRIASALFSLSGPMHADPTSARRREVTPTMIVLIFAGLVLAAAMTALVALLGS
ncbi:MAG: hypothetical protein J7520_06060 [Dokdonella sp.]|nr:hypothetical protein [Dokdonella sp.]